MDLSVLDKKHSSRGTGDVTSPVPLDMQMLQTWPPLLFAPSGLCDRPRWLAVNAPPLTGKANMANLWWLARDVGDVYPLQPLDSLRSMCSCPRPL